MSKGYFVTGTDTGVGKTWASLAIMAHLQQQGHTVVGMKPVASGCERVAGGLRNEDALLIQQQGSLPLPYDTVNPYAFAPAIAPHIAAKQAKVQIRLDTLRADYLQLTQQAEWVIVEGAGGWLVPLNDSDNMADLAKTISLPVVLVVGLRLGCINHALLSAQSIRAHGCQLAGWIANTLEPQMPCLEENIASIAARIAAPLLGILPHQHTLAPDDLGQHLRLSGST